jgi:hypothetical protein
LPAPEALAVEVQSQAARLQALMAQAPAPESSTRNPFVFRAAPRAERAVSSPAPPVEDTLRPLPPPLPALVLMGMAEDSTPAGPRRTAIIGGDGDTLYIVGEGDAVGERYRVTKIGADAVELEDIVTKAYRRLALR